MIEQPKQQRTTTTMPPLSLSPSHHPQLQTPSAQAQPPQHWAGGDSPESYCGLDPDPNKPVTALAIKHTGADGPSAVWSEDSKVEASGDSLALDSCRNSFSHARKDEWPENKLGSDAFQRRPASIDFNSIAMASSPRNGALSKVGPVYSHRSGTFPSPGAPNYRHGSSVFGLQKGWSSERVPLARHGNRRRAGSTMLPYSYGRTLPSKWEDAERWIFSPVDGFGRPGVPNLHRQHKSISGPISIGPPGIAYYSLYSPCIPVPGGAMENRMAGTAFSAGVIAADGSGIHYPGHGRRHSDKREPCLTRSASVHGCSTDVPESLGETVARGAEGGAANVSRDVSRRDFATQMSPEGSAQSSPRKRPSTSTLSIVESQSYQSSHSDVKDVEVDERVTVTKWPKKNKARKSRSSGSHNAEDWAKKTFVPQSCPWEASETRKSVARYAREEARIAAWENLQKAKAEAAMRRLEMKLEKKRSSSMDKIMTKLRSAQRRAQDMRSSVVAANQTQTSSQKAILPRKGKTRQVRSLSGCFTCHAF
uniref:Remorin C-terminal domain-containing protein n=1 Tax=Kalanchoe fedtschenkoi TaxID=63787 RepID=A0A7N0TPD9_KALFE